MLIEMIQKHLGVINMHSFKKYKLTDPPTVIPIPSIKDPSIELTIPLPFREQR